MNCKITALILILLLLVVASLAKKSKFNMRPNVDDTVKLELDGVKCTFWYQISGGSSEEWEISLEKDRDQFSCLIGRGRMSSLFFKNFYASVEGAKITEVEVLDSSDAPLSVVIKNNKVTPTEGWQGAINMIGIASSTAKSEL